MGRLISFFFFSFFLLFNGMDSKRPRYGCMSRELHVCTYGRSTTVVDACDLPEALIEGPTIRRWATVDGKVEIERFSTACDDCGLRPYKPHTERLLRSLARSSSLTFTASSNPLEGYSLREILRNTPESISDLSARDLSLSFWPQIS